MPAVLACYLVLAEVESAGAKKQHKGANRYRIQLDIENKKEQHKQNQGYTDKFLTPKRFHYGSVLFYKLQTVKYVFFE